MIPVPNFLAGVLIGIVNTSWAAVILACCVWSVVFCGYVSIADSTRKEAAIKDFRSRGRRLLFGSATLTFYGIEFYTALMTSLTVGCLTHIIKRIVT